MSSQRRCKLQPCTPLLQTCQGVLPAAHPELACPCCSQVREFPSHGSVWSRVVRIEIRVRARPDAWEGRTWSHREVAGGFWGQGQGWVQTQRPAGSPRALGAVWAGRPSEGSPKARAWASIPGLELGKGAAGSTLESQGAGQPPSANGASRSHTLLLPAPLSLLLSCACQPASDHWTPAPWWVGFPQAIGVHRPWEIP